MKRSIRAYLWCTLDSNTTVFKSLNAEYRFETYWEVRGPCSIAECEASCDAVDGIEEREFT